jgi:hypothetical protein
MFHPLFTNSQIKKEDTSMHSARKLIAVFTALALSLTTFIPTFASASPDTEMDALTDFLTVAFTTGDAISELESFTQMDFEISTP